MARRTLLTLFLLLTAQGLLQAQLTGKAELKDVSEEPLVAKITLPWNNALVRAEVPVFGFAGGKKFQAYHLEYGEGHAPKTWIPIASGTKPWNKDPWSAGEVKWHPGHGAKGTLGNWRTGLTSYRYGHWKDDLLGEYTLRLTVEGADGSSVEDRVHVVVAEVITKVTGGTVRSPDNRFHLTADPGIIETNFVLVSMLPSSEPKPDPRLKVIGTPYEFRPPGLTFFRPASLTASWKETDLDTNGDGKPDIPPERLGLYFYKPVEEIWERMPSRVVPSSRTVAADMSGSTKYLAYVALMADLEPPATPKFRPFETTLPGYSAAFHGEAEPRCEVVVMIDGQAKGRWRADESGRFRTDRLRLAPGRHELTAIAIDPSGNESLRSEPVAFSLAPTPPKYVKSLRWLGNVQAHHGERFMIELMGEDASDRTDHALVKVTSQSDPAGITIELTETGPRTGTYVGLLNVGDASLTDPPTIKAMLNREVIAVSTPLDPAKTGRIQYIDDRPPSLPDIRCPAYPMLVRNTFEESDAAEALAGWETVEGRFGAAVSVGEMDGNRFAKLTRQQWHSHMGVVTSARSFDTATWPFVSFDCLIPTGLKIDLLVHVARLGTFTARLTGETPYHPLLGEVRGVADDGRWHAVLINLHAMLSRRFPETKSFLIERLEFAGLTKEAFLRKDYAASGAQGVWMGVDNLFVFRHHDLGAVAFTWTSKDPNGIGGYSVVFDRAPGTVPSQDPRPQPAATFPLTEPGQHYLHVRAVDGCGNWSYTAHYMLIVDREPPSVERPAFTQTKGQQTLRVPLRDEGVGLDFGSMVLRLGDHAYDWQSGTLDYDAESRILTLNTWKEEVPHLWAQGERLAASLTVADLVGRVVQDHPLGEFVAESPLRVDPPNPDGRNGFYITRPQIRYEAVSGERAFFEWRIGFDDDAFSRKGQSLNSLLLKIKYPDGKERHFRKDFKLDTTTPETRAYTVQSGGRKSWHGGVLPLGAAIYLEHEDYALETGGLSGAFYAKPDYKDLLHTIGGTALEFNGAWLPEDTFARSGMWEGYVHAATAGDYDLRFSQLDPFAELVVRIDGESVGSKAPDQVAEYLDTRVFLTKGWHRFEVRYAPKTALSRAPAFSWKRPDRPSPESVPRDVLSWARSLATTYYRWDDGPWHRYDESLKPLPGEHRLSFYSEDLAGHREPATTVQVSVR